jgi:tRNA pseudouridine55 synthase
MPLHGLLNVNKPAGLTSRRVVDRVARVVRPAKAGHAGTLDPLATGVLVVAVGSATRLIQYLHQMPKSYVGTFLLGRRSTTEDVEGEVTELEGAAVPTSEDIVRAAQSMVGPIQQRPPAFSAIKIQGRRAYDLARNGQPPELEPRPVTIYRLDVVSYSYPELTLSVDCSSGTYIRSLGRDLALSLGTCAVMSQLVRTAVGSFTLDKAVEIDLVSPSNWTTHLLPSARAVERLQAVHLSEEESARVRLGQPIQRARNEDETDDLAGMDPSGRLVSILRRRSDELLGPVCNLSPA